MYLKLRLIHRCYRYANKQNKLRIKKGPTGIKTAFRRAAEQPLQMDERNGMPLWPTAVTIHIKIK